MVSERGLEDDPRVASESLEEPMRRGDPRVASESLEEPMRRGGIRAVV